ncbi:hypothetical protein ACFDTO_05760 [Microbacteriaceae bacterium 4G12]
MKHPSRPLLIGSAVAASAVLVAVAVGTGIGATAGTASGSSDASDTGSASASAEPAPAPTAVTSFPGLATADSDTPTLATLASAEPQAGTAVQAAGPFDDRFVLQDLAFGESGVTGSVEVTSDVSEVIELEVIAGFYGADGTLLGENSFVLHADEEESGHAHTHSGPPEEVHAFTVPVPPSLAGQAVSAAVGVPVLVNE